MVRTLKKYPYQKEEDCVIQIAEPEVMEKDQVIVLIHGGYWRQEKSLETLTKMQTFFVAQGYLVCNIEYRRGKKNPWPTPLNDVKTAIQKIELLYPAYDIVLIGHSVGGQLALLNAEKKHKVIALAPVTDLIYTNENELGDDAVAEYFGNSVRAEELLEASPQEHLPLTVENVRIQSRLHPRCGTNFLLIVMVVSIFVFAFLGWPNLLERIVSRVLLMPVIAGIAYECIRFAGRSENSFVKSLVKPGLALQYMTTREPEADQIEVAIRALEEVRPPEEDAYEDETY